MCSQKRSTDYTILPSLLIYRNYISNAITYRTAPIVQLEHFSANKSWLWRS